MWALKSLDIRLLRCALCFYLSVQICDAVQQRKDVTAKHTASGCFHNNTMFADTSIIPSTEPCLLCKCSNKNLVCVRRVCKDQPYPPPRSCILVHKKSLCCPYLSCSKYHINFYKNSERNREHLNALQVSHEKTLEKSSRTDDGEEEVNGGCIESGSLYASGSAMAKSTSLCSFCYCINGQQKCIKPKCELHDTKCKPIFMNASCCPVKYDCALNSTASTHHDGKLESHKHLTAKRKNRSNGCFESGNYYQEGEKLPSDAKRPCEMCYCIKGLRKCVVKKCAPLIRGCIPKVPKEGNCCPTSYDCSRSLKARRQVRQHDEDQAEENNDSIDFFSLLFGSDEPQEETTTARNGIEVTTLQPFKALPSTEKSFFDLIRAGLEIIDANADKIDSKINKPLETASETEAKERLESTTVENKINSESLSAKFTEITLTTRKPERTSTSVIKSPDKFLTTSTESTTLSLTKSAMTVKPPRSSTTQATLKTSPQTDSSTKLTVSSATKLPQPSTKIKATTLPSRRIETTTELHTTRKIQPSSTAKTEKLRETTPKVLIETTRASTSIARTTTTTRPTISTRTTPTRTTSKFTTTEGHQRHEGVHFTHVVQPDSKIIDTDDNEAETLPNIEIIPFVAHDAIDTTKPFDPYLKPYDNLEKDYFANDKEKPFRYNNKFTHSYDDSSDYGYSPGSNPHERIDNSPYYFETNDNQFDAFSPPSEQDFLGGFSPKDSIYDEVSTMASPKVPLESNEFAQKPLNAAHTIHEHKSNVTSTEKTLTSPINQATHDAAKQSNVIPDFKKISSNFSYIDDLVPGNVLEETTTKRIYTTTSTTSAPASTTPVVPVKSPIGLTEIFSKPTAPTMNGLLKLAGCNIYGQMYEVGHIIVELSNDCLECKCLPDIGVGCSPKC